MSPEAAEADAELVVDAGDDAVDLLVTATGSAAPGPPLVAPLDAGERYLARSQPDHLDVLVLQEELRSASARLARLEAAPKVLADLDLPGLAAFRAELTLAHRAALERVDDRRVMLQAHQVATQEGPEPGRCIACWTRKADRVLLPCRHLCVCGTCLHACQSKCPVCRGPVVDAMEVFGA